jgi:hypothetical protein
LKAHYTEVWVPSAVVPLIQFADKVMSIAASRIEMMTDGFVERFQQFDEVISWYNSDQEKLKNINKNVVFHPALPGNSGLNATDFYARQVGAPWGLIPHIKVHRHVARETIVIHPFSGSVRKNWAYANFEELAQRLPLPVEWAQERFENLLELAQWMAGARLYIGNDSGITHLAGAISMPVLAIFAVSDPQIWAPVRAKILRNPEVEQVVKAATELLACERR